MELDPLALWLRCILCPVMIPILFLYAYCFRKDSKIQQGKERDDNDNDDDDDDDDDEEEEQESNALLCILNLVLKLLSYCGYNIESNEDHKLTKTKDNFEPLNLSKQIVNRNFDAKFLSKDQLKKNSELALDIGRTDRMIIEHEGDWINGLFIEKLDANGKCIPRRVNEVEEKYDEDDEDDELLSVEEPIAAVTKKHVRLFEEPVMIEDENEHSIEQPLIGKPAIIPDTIKNKQVNVTTLKELLTHEYVTGPTLSSLANQSSPSLKSANQSFDQISLKEQIRNKRRPWEPGSPMDDLINHKLNEYTSYINDDNSVGSMSVVDRLIIEYNHPKYLSSDKNGSAKSSFSESVMRRKISIDSTTSDMTAQTFEN